MNPLDSYKINNSTLYAMRHLQENGALSDIRKLQTLSGFTSQTMETTNAFVAAKELQGKLDTIKSFTGIGDTNVTLDECSKTIAQISKSIRAINLAYAPIFEQTKAFDALNIKDIILGLQTSISAMSAISELNLSKIASIVDALPKYDFLSDMVSDDFTIADAEELYESGEITQDDINEEISVIVNKKQFSPKAEWDKLKKSKWFLAIKILMVLVAFVCKPFTEYVTDKAIDKLGINEFWEDSGVYDLIDSIFGGNDDGSVSETEAKKTVGKDKTGKEIKGQIVEEIDNGRK